MYLSHIIESVVAFVAIRQDNPELLKAQRMALSRLIPLMYFMLSTNGWILAYTFYDLAPIALTVLASSALTIVCLVRVAVWWPIRNREITARQAVTMFRVTNVLAAVLAGAFVSWALALFPYGDPYAQGNVAIFIVVSMIGCMMCLIHARTAALIVAAVGTTTFVGYFVMTQKPELAAMAINVTLVAAALVVILTIQSRDFASLVNAQTDARIREAEQSRLLHMIDDMPIAVMTVNPATMRIDYVNATSRALLERIAHLLPIPPEEVLGADIDTFFARSGRGRKLLDDPASFPHQFRWKLGSEVIDLQVTAVRSNSGEYLGPMVSWAIVTKEVAAENRIHQLAHYDTLTGLANRYTFREQFDAALSHSDRGVSLLLIDLDGFKTINDSKGHNVGDALLQQVAERLRATCSSPGSVVGRLGGDEFAVLLTDGDAGGAQVAAGNLVRILDKPYSLGKARNIHVGASIGIAVAPDHGTDSETLLARADMALYAVKEAGKGAFRIFSFEIERQLQAMSRTETDLRVALSARNQLFVFYQPIVDIRTNAITSREALVRWHHPARGWISPAEFVPVAERSGLIERLGAFVLNSACREAAGWQDGARVAVNVSANQLGRGTLAPAVLQALIDNGLSPDRLEIEVTETALLKEDADTMGDLRRLRDMGVRVALDDFGTGYSSLAHLRVFPFDKIKIDGSFVQDAVERTDCAAVVGAVADLGKRLGVTTVAEGVETQAHLDCVAAEGCSEVQGYLFGRPEPSEADRPMIERLKRSTHQAGGERV